jgi:hypothetical protein
MFRCSASEDCDFQTKYRQTLSTHVREKHEGKKRVQKQPEGKDTQVTHWSTDIHTVTITGTFCHVSPSALTTQHYNDHYFRDPESTRKSNTIFLVHNNPHLMYNVKSTGYKKILQVIFMF